MASALFERFRFSFFEDTYSARDGLDMMALAGLEGEEAIRAENMLIEYLPDARGVIGLGVLRSVRAEPHLAKLFESEWRTYLEYKTRPDGNCFSDGLIYLAKALWQIRPDARWREALIDVLAFGADCTARQTAAEALYTVHDPLAARALIAALDDKAPLVRYHAARALFAMHGLAADFTDIEHPMCRVMAKDEARRDGGKRDILQAIGERPIAAP